jgi:hypothetical protein
MFNEKALTEKLKYLIVLETKDKFEFENFSIDFEYNDGPEGKELEVYEINTTFDYIGIIDPPVSEFLRDVEKMVDKLDDAFSKYGFNKKGKLNTRGGHSVISSMIWNVNFAADTKYAFSLSFRVLT